MHINRILFIQNNGSHGLLKLFTALLALLPLLVPGVRAADHEVKSGAPEEIPFVDRSLLLDFLVDNSTLTLIDARTPEEFSELHLPGAINIPFDQLEANTSMLPEDRERPVIVYCRTGRRAGLLQEKLTARGFTDVRILPGAQIIWQEDSMAFNCGKQPAAFRCNENE